MLNASQSYDSDGDPITYLWRQIAGPAVKIDDATSNTPSFTAPTVSTDSNLIFELTVKDDKGAKGTSIITITDKPSTNTHTNTTTAILPYATQQLSSPTNPVYTNPTYGISINYPPDWTKEEGSGTANPSTGPLKDIVTFIPTKYVNVDSIPVVVTVVIDTEPKSDLDSILKNEISAYKQGDFTKVKVISSDTQSNFIWTTCL